jgi:2-haloacid dehalogenase
MSPPAVRALLFDVFGTVVDWRTGIAAEAARLLGGRGLARDWLAFADDWRGRYQPAMAAVRSGGRPFAKLDVLHRENLAQTLAAFGIAELDEALIDELNRAWHRLPPWPDVVPGLARLRPRYLLAPVSNGHVALMVALARHGGLPWDAILGAEVARAYKPQPAVYLAAAELLDLPPAACLMVAAHADDLDAAAACGLRTAYVARPAEYGPPAAGAVPAPPPGRYDLEVDSFLALADRLGC